ncbi:MAG: hypothetical protein V3W28_05985, partial [Thermoplasmata archaeon]
MPYVEWHDTVRNHYKTDDLMRRLKTSLGREVPRREAVGIIGCISSWSIQFRPGGLIERNLIAVAVEWTEDPEKLVDALIKAEWLDRKGPKVAIHDWKEITRGYRKARKDAARRSRDRSAATERLPPRSDPKGSELNEQNERRGEGVSPLADLENRARLERAAVAARIPNNPETLARYIEAWVARSSVDEVERILRLPESKGRTVNDIQDA